MCILQTLVYGLHSTLSVPYRMCTTLNILNAGLFVQSAKRTGQSRGLLYYLVLKQPCHDVKGPF